MSTSTGNVEKHQSEIWKSINDFCEINDQANHSIVCQQEPTNRTLKEENAVHRSRRELDTIELFEHPENGRLIGEATQKQKDVYVKQGLK